MVDVDPDYSDLIATVYEYGCYRAAGRRAIASLVKDGEPAFAAFLAMRQKPPPSEVPPRDLADTIIEVIGQFSKELPDVVLDRFEAGELDEFETYWALGSGTGERSIDVLIAGLGSKNKFCRWAAAESLIRRRSERAVPALLDALKDRSPLVKSTVVQAMKEHRSFRRAEALPALRRIAASKAISRQSPGLHKAAENVIRLIEHEAGQTKA